MRFVISVIIGTVLVSAYSAWSPSALRPEVYSAASGSGLRFTVAGNSTPLLHPRTPNLSASNDNLSADGSESPPDVSCSTKVILAVFFKARYCVTGTLVVVATSELSRDADLELVDHGPMQWESQNGLWFIKIRNLQDYPVIVTVEGTECTTQAPVLTVPSGCEVKLPFDSGHDL